MQVVNINKSRHFGAMVEHLANRALSRFKSGTYDPDREDLMLRHSWPMRDAIVPLGLSIGQLRHWMLTGTIEGKPYHATAPGY